MRSADDAEAVDVVADDRARASKAKSVGESRMDVVIVVRENAPAAAAADEAMANEAGAADAPGIVDGPAGQDPPAAAPTPATAPPAADAALANGETLSVVVTEGTGSATTRLRVGDDGTIDVPSVGRVTAAGRSTAHVEREIVQLIQRKNLRSTARVTVTRAAPAEEPQ
jgi:hypothetical protein